MNFKQYFYLASLIICIIATACNNSESKNTEKPSEPKPKVEKKIEVKKVPSVCVWDKGSVKESPKKKGKYISAMSLGEKVSWLNKTEIDQADKNRKYYNVELSDGTKGWVSEYVLAVDGKPAIAIKEIPVYRRPGLLTLTETTFKKMEFIVVLKKEGEWLKVLGKEKKKKGWIKEGMVSYTDANVAAGLLANKAFALKDSLKMRERIGAIIDNPSFSKSTFIKELKEMLKESKKRR